MIFLLLCLSFYFFSFFFFFNDTATTEIYTFLHDALPIYDVTLPTGPMLRLAAGTTGRLPFTDRKSTRLNSSHLGISYAVFCLKKKKHKDVLSSTYKKSRLTSAQQYR